MTFFIFKFQIARVVIRTDVKSAEIAVMFRFFVFLSESSVAQFVCYNAACFNCCSAVRVFIGFTSDRMLRT